MKISLTKKSLNELRAPALVIFYYLGQKSSQIKTLGKDTEAVIEKLGVQKDFTGKQGQSKLIFSAGAIPRILLVGLGKKETMTLEKLRVAASTAIAELRKSPVSEAALLPPEMPGINQGAAIQALAETVLLSAYTFEHYKKQDEEAVPLSEILIISTYSGAEKALKEGEILGRAVNMARDLGNHPSNVATPSHLAKHAKELSKNFPKIKVRILDRAEIKKEGMGALLAVAQGSEEEPRFIILEYLPRRLASIRRSGQAGHGKKSGAPVVLVGKGVTFDSGGLSLKPWEKMDEMKFDMAGAATVFGIFQAAVELKLPVDLVGLIPASENLPSGKALKPGDIVKSRSGKTIEVLSTDAEGRMMLADALDFAKNYRPELVIDFATLTGSIVVALGDDIIGAFSNRDQHLQKLRQASDATGEALWPMPLYKEYEPLIKSHVAELRNNATIRYGDAIHASLFLQNFVDFPWIHLDIAGVAWATREKPYRAVGATGSGVRLAIEFLKNYKKQK